MGLIKVDLKNIKTKERLASIKQERELGTNRV